MINDNNNLTWFPGDKGGEFGVDPATWRYIYRTAEGREYNYNAGVYKDVVIPNLLKAHPGGVITDYDFADEFLKIKPAAKVWSDFRNDHEHFQKLRGLWGYDFAFLLAVKVLVRTTTRGTRPHHYSIQALDTTKGTQRPDASSDTWIEHEVLLETIKTQDNKIKLLEQQLSHEKQVATYLEELRKQHMKPAVPSFLRTSAKPASSEQSAVPEWLTPPTT